MAINFEKSEIPQVPDCVKCTKQHCSAFGGGRERGPPLGRLETQPGQVPGRSLLGPGDSLQKHMQCLVNSERRAGIAVGVG